MKAKKVMGRKILLAVNGLLFLVIVVYAVLKIYSVKVTFDCEYGTDPGQLLTVATNNFPGLGNNELKAICVFNKLPGMDVLENVEKLCTLYKERVSFGVIFAEKFKPMSVFGFPFKMLPGYRFSCGNKGGGFDRNYFLLIQGKKVVHSSDIFDFFALNFVIQKKLVPNLSLSTAHMPTKELKSGIVKRMTEKELQLLDLNTGGVMKFNDMTQFSKIYFFHANCSGCRLKALLQNIKLLETLDEEKAIIIFSIYANRFELKSLLEQDQTDLPIYIDTKDEFLLSSKITDDKETPIIITGEELRRP